MINSVRLNHTVWYSYEKKIIRINISDMLPEPLMSYSYTVSGQIEHPGLVKVHSISKDIKVFGDFDPLLFLFYAPLSGSSEETKKDDWDSRVELKWDEQHKSFDIILPPHKDFDVDGEMVVTIYYHVYNGIADSFTEDISSFMNTQYKLDVVIPFRSHNNPVKDNSHVLYRQNVYTNVAIRNSKTNITGTLPEPVIYECNLVTRDVSDENPSYSDVLDMIKIEGRKDVRLELNNDTLTVTVGDLMSSVNLAKYRDENTNNTLNVEDLKRDILSIVDGKLPNVETIKQEILADVNPRIPDKETIKQEVLAAVPTSSTSYELTPDKMTKAIVDNEMEMKGFIDVVFGYSNYNHNLELVKTDNAYEIRYRYNERENEINHFSMDYNSILTIPFSSLRELPTATAGEPVTLEKILELVSDESKSEVISQLKSKLASTPLTAEQILDKATEAAADREKAGKLFQKLLDAETLNVVEKTDGYELSYTGDVNKVLVKIPKQAITVSQEVITAALTENVVTETIKPTLDKTYYSKEEVDNLIKKLKEELTAEDHDTHSAEEHPQQ